MAWDFFFRPPDAMPAHIEEMVPPPPIDVPVQDERIKTRGDVGAAASEVADKVVEKTPEKVVEKPPQPTPPAEKAPKLVRKQKQVSGSGTGTSGGGGGGVVGTSMVAPSEGSSKRGKAVGPQNTSLLQILNELDDHFLKASESAHEVSKMLEANRLHYHSNFADNRGHIDHSARVMRVITWNRSFKNLPPNADDGKDDFDKEENETHATILDKLLAWEKKLYDEVKAGELMKLEYQRKVNLLNKQKKRSTNPETLEKTKAAVSHLHTRYIVDIQSMDATVKEIYRLRDEQLFPKLSDLVREMAKMWETMRIHHEAQLKIVTDLRALDYSNAPKETSYQHHDRTRQLCRILGEWHSQFTRLMTHQKEYIQDLNNWLKLTLIPIESSLKERVSSPPRVQRPPIQALLFLWHEQLDKLPVELAKSAIFSFAAVMNAILVHQEEELKQKEKFEEAKRDFEHKQRAFTDWREKFLKRRPPASASEEAELERVDAADTSTNDQIAERKIVVDTAEKKKEEELEAHQKLCRQVREKSLNSLKTHLPELFRALTDFSYACSVTYKKLYEIAEPDVEKLKRDNVM